MLVSIVSFSCPSLTIIALLGAFNQEKALVVIVKTGCGTDGSFYSTSEQCLLNVLMPRHDRERG